MKIINTLKLDTKRTALELDRDPTDKEKAAFNRWAKQCEISKYVTIDIFYRADMFGDSDYSAIMVEPKAPKEIKTLCLLKWS